MKLSELASRIGAEILTQGLCGDAEIGRVYAGDRVSDLLNEASSETLLVTSLSGRQIVRIAELMDVPAICLVKGTRPDADMIAAAAQKGTAVLVSPDGMFETCGRLYDCLNGKGQQER